MVSHRGFTAWISCDGETLEEYETRTETGEGGRTATCWIPSTADKVLWPCYLRTQGTNEKIFAFG